MLKLLALGVGNGFTQKLFHTNFLLHFENEYMLIDAGTTLRYSLQKGNVHPSQITSVFITHFHHDHAGGLAEFLMQCHWQFADGKHIPHKPVLLARPSQLDDIHRLLAPMLDTHDLQWQDYCSIRIIENNQIQLGGIEFHVLPTDNMHCPGFNSCGIKITDRTGANIIISGDIKDLASSGILSHINRDTHAIVQDVSFYDSAVHSTYKEVLNYYPSHYYPIIYGVHYDDDYIPDKKIKFSFLKEGKTLLIP